MNEGIQVGDAIVIVSDITRSHVRLAVHADKSIRVIRLSPEEVRDAIGQSVAESERS